MQESIKLARSKAKNPDQENIRQLKQDWNSDTSEFVHSLIQFKKLMNGRESDFYKQKSKITDPIPVEPSIVIQSLAQKFKDLAEQAYVIGNKQKEYSGNRLARRKEASNKITRLLSYIKGPHFGSSPEATLNRSRKSLLSLAADVSKDFKILNSKILGRSHSSLLEAGVVFKRLRETLSAFVTFINNLENPTKALPEPKEEKSRKIDYMRHYLDYFAGPEGAVNKIKTDLRSVLNKINVSGKEHLLPLIFKDIEEIEKISGNIENSEDTENKIKLAEFLYEKIQALKETLKSLFPENISPPRKDNTIKTFVDAFKAHDFPKKPENTSGRKPGGKNKSVTTTEAPAGVASKDADPPATTATPQSKVEDLKSKEENPEAVAPSTEPEAIEDPRLLKLNELIDFYNKNIKKYFIFLYNFAKVHVVKNVQAKEKQQVKQELVDAKNRFDSDNILDIVTGLDDILIQINKFVPSAQAKEIYNMIHDSNIFTDGKLKPENLTEETIAKVKDLFEKTKNQILSNQIYDFISEIEATLPNSNGVFYIKNIIDIINSKNFKESKFLSLLKQLTEEINLKLKNDNISFRLDETSPNSIVFGLKEFKDYVPTKENKEALETKKKDIIQIFIAKVKKYSRAFIRKAVEDFKHLNEIPQDSDPKLISDIFAIRGANALPSNKSDVSPANDGLTKLPTREAQNKAFDWAKRKLHEISFWNKTSPLRLKISDFSVKAKKATDELMDDLEHRISFQLLENYKTAIVDLFSRIEDLMSALLAGSEARSANIDNLLEARYLDGLEISPEDKKKVENAFALRRQKRLQNNLMGL